MAGKGTVEITAPTFGDVLRRWRLARRMSQLTLFTEAEISSRHLSFLETGRAHPSREMVLLLAGVLDVPLRSARGYTRKGCSSPRVLGDDGDVSAHISNEVAFEKLQADLGRRFRRGFGGCPDGEWERLESSQGRDAPPASVSVHFRSHVGSAGRLPPTAHSEGVARGSLPLADGHAAMRGGTLSLLRRRPSEEWRGK